jgi:methionyl aminopeptidase
MSIGSERDLAGMRRAGRVVAEVLAATRAAVEPGVTTLELDRVAADALAAREATSAPADVYDAPCAIFVSVNADVVHGLPRPRALAPGDVVKLDVTAAVDGYVADAAVTVVVPPASTADARLAACARAALADGMAQARAGAPVRRIGAAVERRVRRGGFTVLRELTGHGVGRTIHEPPTIPNWDDPRARGRLHEGLVLTIEPLITAGRDALIHDADGWTLTTADGRRAAHVEHTIVVTRGRPIVLTAAA